MATRRIVEIGDDKLRKHGLPFNTPGENPPDDGE